MGLMQSSASGTLLHTCPISKVSWGRGEKGEHLCVHSAFHQGENVSLVMALVGWDYTQWRCCFMVHLQGGWS